MLPLLMKLSADGPISMWIAYAIAAGLIVYAARSGYVGAVGPLDSKSGKFAPPTPEDRYKRAGMFGAAGVALAWIGLYFALPSRFPFGGRGEGIPIHTYGVMIGTGFLLAV